MSTVVDRPTPRLAGGVEVLGEYAGSGYKEPHYMVRRGDGQIIQLSHLIHVIVGEIDGARSVEDIAGRVSEQIDRNVSGDQVASLIGDKLEPLGLVPAADGSDPPVKKSSPLLRLRLRTKALPESVVRKLAVPFKPLFFPPVVVVAVAGWVALTVWLLFIHGLGEGLRQAVFDPKTFLLVLGLVVVSAAFREFGHAAACAYGGAQPGIIGAGVYLAWPAFFTDVTDTYRLGRAGRLRTDLGGVYFNVLFSLATFAVYVATSFEPLLLVITMQQVEMLHQLIPIVRLDGYYILADVTGVPDLFRRVRPILRSMVPGRKIDPAADELKPWVRRVVSGWVLVIVPVLGFNLVAVVIYLPRMLTTAWDSAQLQFTAIRQAVEDVDVLVILAGVVQTIALAIPILGITLTLWTVGRKVVAKTSDRPAIRIAAVAALAGLGIWALLPDNAYSPLVAGERLRYQDVAAAVVAGDPTRSAPAEAEAPASTPAPAPAPADSRDSGDTPAGEPQPEPPADGSAPADPEPDGGGDPAPVAPGVAPPAEAPALPVPPVTLPVELPIEVPPVELPNATLPALPEPPASLPVEPPVTVPETIVPETVVPETAVPGTVVPGTVALP